MILDVSLKNMALPVFIWLVKMNQYNAEILLMKYQIKFLNIMSKVKRTFSSAVRQPYQDAIGIILKIIDYHNEQARKDFGNHQFHSKQATALKLWMIDMKEFITKHEKKESLSIQDTEEETGREEVLSSIDENV
jgi:hypothetical protein